MEVLLWDKNTFADVFLWSESTFVEVFSYICGVNQ